MCLMTRKQSNFSCCWPGALCLTVDLESFRRAMHGSVLALKIRTRISELSCQEVPM